MKKADKIILCCISVTIITTICNLKTTGYTANNTEHQETESSKNTILDWSGWNSGSVFEVDGNPQTNKNRVELTPGPHNIEYGGEIGTSFLLNPKMSDKYTYSATINMIANHTYKVLHERTYVYGGYSDYFWIEDRTSGEIMAGNVPGYRKEKIERSETARLERESKIHFDELTVQAECQDSGAQYDLALYYLAGIPPETKADITKAYVWYSLSAFNGKESANAVKKSILKDLRPENLLEANYLISKLKQIECTRDLNGKPTSKKVTLK